MIAARSVGLTYGDSVALHHVDLRIESGEVVALEGPSGSGKSSLMYCLAGLLVPTAGEVRFDGAPLSALGGEERTAVRRARFGFVFQFADLVPELTLAENVMLPCEINGFARGEARDRADRLLDRLGIGTLADRRPDQTSGGQRQRAAVARALAHEPAVLFADEPTGALDSENGARVLDELLALTGEAGSTLVVVTHDPSVAARCPRRLVLSDGRITSDGTSSDVTGSERTTGEVPPGPAGAAVASHS